MMPPPTITISACVGRLAAFTSNPDLRDEHPARHAGSPELFLPDEESADRSRKGGVTDRLPLARGTLVFVSASDFLGPRLRPRFGLDHQHGRRNYPAWGF